ncbi:MAG: transglycosylase SLT domain-containing protein [Flavobacteriales bacterium]|nr:transglycosylase SLT domain-containing protein [Flavobacteriales bacterium]
MKRRWWVFVAISALFILAVAVLMRVSSREEAWRPWQGETAERDLPAITGDTLRILVTHDPLVWEPGPGGGTGLAFEWLERFARIHKLVPLAVPLHHPDSLLTALWQGRGDVVAAPIMATREFERHFAFAEAILELAPYLAELRVEMDGEGTPGIAAVHDSMLLAVSSPFADNHYRFDRDFAKRSVLGLSARLSEDELLMDVLLDRTSAAVVSGLRAAHESNRFPVLQFDGPLGPPLEWRFVVRRNAPLLREALNGWVADPKEREARAVLLRGFSGPIAAPGPLRSRRMKGAMNDSISPFDEYFREHANGLAYDWQLLAAMAWKESRFDSTVTSSKGAMGIMQIMPRTAARFGLDTSSAMADHVRAAARYVARLDTLWMRAIPDRQQRLRFVLASYNAGPGHIIDAQRLAAQLGLDPERWEGHVERAVLLLAKPRYFQRPELKNGYCKGSQVFHYVRGVLVVQEQLRARGRAAKRKG